MKKKICIALIAAFSVLLIVSGYFVISHYVEARKQNELFENLIEQVEESETALNEEVQLTPDKTVLPNYTDLFNKNRDMVGWISIEDTHINYPVMQSVNEPNFYLKHGFNKQYSRYGCPYVQENCDMLAPSDNIIIYGHHMNDGAMFAELEKFKKESFWENHKIINFDTLTEQGKYEIISVFKTVAYTDSNDAFPYYQFVNAEKPEDFKAYVDKCKALSLYDTRVSAEYGDKLITLSTCEYSRKNGRLVVVAKKVVNDTPISAESKS